MRRIWILAIAFAAFACNNAPKEQASGTEETQKEQSAQEAKPAAADQKTLVDVEASTFKWYGHKPTEDHFGAIRLKEGELILNNGQLVGGLFVIDMSSITVEDIEDAESNGHLAAHLNNEDFFDVSKHPTAKFEITGVETTADNKANISGQLTIKGISQPASFIAETSMEGNKFSASGKLTFDRTKYEIKYKSKTFFGDLGDKFILDEIDLEMNVVATI